MVFLPLVGGLVLMFVRDSDEAGRQRVRAASLAISLLTFLISAAMYFGFRADYAEMQFLERAQWIPRFGISYHVGLDGISLPLILLTTFLTPITILFSWRDIGDRVRLYHMAVLFLETGMLGVFVALDFFLFYVFWEGWREPLRVITLPFGGYC